MGSASSMTFMPVRLVLTRARDTFMAKHGGR